MKEPGNGGQGTCGRGYWGLLMMGGATGEAVDGGRGNGEAVDDGRSNGGGC